MVGEFKFKAISIDKEDIWRNYPTVVFTVLVSTNVVETFCINNVHICVTMKTIFVKVFFANIYWIKESNRAKFGQILSFRMS